jgi:hypothetical protein
MDRISTKLSKIANKTTARIGFDEDCDEDCGFTSMEIIPFMLKEIANKEIDINKLPYK